MPRNERHQENKTDMIEILLAAYQGEEFIREQINSILQQSYTDWHLTISDDGSTDKTVAIIHDYQNRYPDQIKRVCSHKKFGTARDHFFWLLQNCGADYICFCDQDDVWKPDKLQLFADRMREMEAAEGKNTPILVFSDLCVVDEDLNVISDSIMYLQQQKANVADYHELLFKNVVNGNAMMINRALAELSLRCLAPEQTIMHDWWIAITAARFGKISYIDRATVLYRQHGGNDVGAKKARGIGFILRKLTHLKTLLKSFDQKAAQTGVFLNTFRDVLKPEECLQLVPFSQRKMSVQEKLAFCKWLTSASRKIGFLLLW